VRHIVFVDHLRKQQNKYSAVLCQGDLEGCDRVYSLMMCLNLMGYEAAATHFMDIDKRTIHGKVIKRIEKRNIMSDRNASENIEISDIIKEYKDEIYVSDRDGEDEEGLNHVIMTIHNEAVAIVKLLTGDVFYWAVAPGMEFNIHGKKLEQFRAGTSFLKHVMPERIFLLDPRKPKIDCCLWNDYLLIQKDKNDGRYRLSDGQPVSIIRVISVCRKVDQEKMEELLEIYYKKMLNEDRMSKKEAKERLKRMDPFFAFPDIVERLR
jgi:hypothetical protein